MLKSRMIALAVLGVALLWILSGGHHDKQQEAEAKASAVSSQRQALKRVSVITAEPQMHGRRLSVTGRTEAKRKVQAVARSSGTVGTLPVIKGSRVKEGAILAQFNDDGREASVNESRALLKQRQAELSAAERLLASGSTPRLTWEAKKAAVEAAKAQLEKNEAEVERAVVLAPFSGVVNTVAVEKGQAVQVGQSVAEVLMLDPLIVVARVSERSMGLLQVGSAATVRLISGETAQGVITYVSRTADEKTRTWRIEVEVPNPEAKWADGLSAEILVMLKQEPAVRLARSALTLDEMGRVGVKVVDTAGIVSFTPVGIVDDEPEAVWVSGVGKGQSIIVVGQDFIANGVKVEAVPLASSSSSGSTSGALQ